MTNTKTRNNSRAPIFKRSKRYIFTALSILAVIILIRYSAPVGAAVIGGINLAAKSIIPSLFPFLILSDVFIYSFGGSVGIFGRAFSRLFGISPSASGAFISGCFSGFPIGVKSAADLYHRGDISKGELERLIGFVNNPSPAFVIGAVGTMRGSAREGAVLYISVILAAIFTGILFRSKDEKKDIKNQPIKNDFNLSASIKNAAYTSIGISAYIIFFSVLLGLIGAIFNSPAITLFFSLFLEIGNAASLLAASGIDSTVTLALTAFALGFSGLSVYMQAKSLLPDGTSMKKYIIMKIAEGGIAAVIALLIINLL